MNSNGEMRRAFVRGLFDRIAGTYDLLNHVLSAGIDIVWRRSAIDGLRPGPAWRVLDLATGTGDLAFEVSRRNFSTSVVGVDISLPMLRKAVGKARSRSAPPRFCCGDAEHLPFSDGQFEGVTIGFGIRNVVGVDAALAEIHRVLRPGGRLAVLEFSRPRRFVFRDLYFFYFKHVLPAVGRIVSGDRGAYRYLYESAMQFPEGRDFCRRLENQRFVDLFERRLTFGIATLYLAEKAE